MPNIIELLKMTVDKGGSDLHLSGGLPPVIRICGRLERVGQECLEGNDIENMIREMLPEDKLVLFTPEGTGTPKEIDTALDIEGLGRFRANVYLDKNGYAAAFRPIPNMVKSLRELGLPKAAEAACLIKRGLILITGITGSGKSTTLASMIDKINSERSEHIITIEDPIEFVHNHKKSVVNQREVGTHTTSFPEALRSALREDPDIILVGEMRDLETISMVITAAETGHLVLSTLHTRGAAQTIDRIIDIFPSNQQEQVRQELADVLTMVVSQVLVPSATGRAMYLGSEILVGTQGVKSLIREKQTHQINSLIQTGGRDGMQTLDYSMEELVKAGKVKAENILPWISDKLKFGIR